MNAPQRLELIEPDPPANEPMANAPQQSLSVVQYAVQSGATVAEIRALLELQVQADNHQLALMQERRRMEKEDRAEAAKRAFEEALTRFRGFNVVIPKTKLVQQTARDGGAGPSFMQAEFDVVCRLLSPALSECGFSFRHDQRFGSRKWTTDGVESDVAWVYVTCYLTHSGGHTEKLELDGPPDTSGRKNPLQEMQSSASYLKRQSLLAITGTATGGEDDETKLRAKEKADGASSAAATARAELVQTGNDAAMQGMDALTTWWGALTAKQRNDLSREFAGMKRAATIADQQGGGK